MSEALTVTAPGLARGLVIAAVHSTIVDVPMVRQHKLSQTPVTAQSYVIVQIRLANGADGIGEAATLGGPRWSEESVEAIKANIDAYLTPAILVSPRPSSASAPTVSRRSVSAWTKPPSATTPPRLQSRRRCSMRWARASACPSPSCSAARCGTVSPCSGRWPLATRDRKVEEAERKLEARLHRTFKVKIGAQEPEADMARLRAQPGTPPLLADECVFDARDVLPVASVAAADAVSLKLVKHAGLHTILSTLPLFPFMEITVTPLARHPSAVT